MRQHLTFKVTLVALVFLAFILAAAVFATMNTLALRASVSHLSEHMVERITLSNDFEAYVLRFIVEAQSVVSSGAPGDMDEMQTALDQAKQALLELRGLEEEGDPDVDLALATKFEQLNDQRSVLIANAQRFDDSLKRIRFLDDAESERLYSALEQIEDALVQLSKDTQATLIQERNHTIEEAASALEETVWAIGIGAALPIILVLLALLLLQRWIVRPVLGLAAATEIFAKGNLAERVPVTRKDELGTLQQSFNSMAETLEMWIAAEQAAQQEAQRLQLTESENRQVLEQTVEEYLAFVEQVGAGDLTQQLPIDRAGALGLLGQGLNRMVTQLFASVDAQKQAQTETQRLQKIETESRQQLEQAVAEYLAFVQNVARGDLTQRLTVKYDGALGQLGKGLNTMAESLHALTAQIQQTNQAIMSAVAAILAASTEQSASAAEQSSAITQTATTIEEVRAIAAQTAQHADQMAKTSQNALQVARQGSRKIEETIDSMGQIYERVQEITQTILALSEQTQTISVIITTVNDLADQSNLLALNAAIEAARAGEQGRSFAVVAQNVRDLAERSKKATAQVREILGMIQQASSEAVYVTEEGSKRVETGSKLTDQAGQIIQQIALEVESGAQANIQVASAATQQMMGLEQVSQAMLSIQQATTHTLSSTRQAEQAAQDLQKLAKALQKAITMYRL